MNAEARHGSAATRNREVADFRFTDGGTKATIPFTLAGNIHVLVKVNGHALHFILDSANVDSISWQAAKEVGLDVKGGVEAEGGGSKLVKAGFTTIKSLTVEDKLAVRDQTFVVVPLPHGVLLPLDGTLGYGVLKHFVVHINYVSHTLTFVRPADFDPKNAGTPVTLSFFKDRLPVIPGLIDGLPGRFFVDTGANSVSLQLFTPFATAHDLYTRYHATRAMVTGVSTGGALGNRIARGGTFELGGFIVKDPVVLLSLAKSGFAASKEVDGDIGGRILRRFAVTFDYPDRLVYLKPNEDFRKPMNYDRSGMAIGRETSQGFVILGIMPNGPAQQAGLKTRDIITAVNGKPARQIGWTRFWHMLRNEAPGTRVKLVVERGTTLHTATITLRQLIPETGGLQKAG